VELFKAMTRPSVRECLPTLNCLVERLQNAVEAQVPQPSHPVIATPEKLNKVLKRLELALFVSFPEV
jgi:hypothetical protein